MDDFMRRPTETMVSYLAARTGKSPVQIVRLLELGRVAMAMELITVVKIIEDHSLLPSKEDTIATIQTLIIDQELLDLADEWYSNLSEWRRLRFIDGADVSHATDASAYAYRRGAAPPHDTPDAPPGSDQTKDPPSASSSP